MNQPVITILPRSNSQNKQPRSYAMHSFLLFVELWFYGNLWDMEQQRTLSGSSQSPRSPSSSQPFLSVSVTDPVKLGNGVQAYISYRVITKVLSSFIHSFIHFSLFIYFIFYSFVWNLSLNPSSALISALTEVFEVNFLNSTQTGSVFLIWRIMDT